MYCRIFSLQWLWHLSLIEMFCADDNCSKSLLWLLNFTQFRDLITNNQNSVFRLSEIRTECSLCAYKLVLWKLFSHPNNYDTNKIDHVRSNSGNWTLTIFCIYLHASYNYLIHLIFYLTSKRMKVQNTLCLFTFYCFLFHSSTQKYWYM